MAQDYSLDKSKDYRRIRLEVVTLSIILVMMLAGAAYIYFDLRQPDVIDNSQNQGTLGVVESREEPLERFETDQFVVGLPSSWQAINNPEKIYEGRRYYPFAFRGSGRDEVGRQLLVYVDKIPSFLPVNKLLEVEVNSSNYLTPGLLSPQCYRFTDFPEDRQGEPYPATWDGHAFTCDTSRHTNVIAAVSDNLSDGITLRGRSGDDTLRVLLVYTDHGSAPDNALFGEIVASFRLK